MFSTQKNPDEMSEKELILQLMQEVDEVKRYAANTYQAVDGEIKEILDYIRKVERQVSETDMQVDKIERFERDLNKLESLLKSIERKI